MGNASENFLLVSRISKDNDIIMGSLYTILGEPSHLFPGNVPNTPPHLTSLTSASLSNQLCCRCWGMEPFSWWLTGRSPPWSRRSFSWLIWPSVTWAWRSLCSHSPSLQPTLTCEGTIHNSCFLLGFFFWGGGIGWYHPHRSTSAEKSCAEKLCASFLW